MLPRVKFVSLPFGPPVVHDGAAGLEEHEETPGRRVGRGARAAGRQHRVEQRQPDRNAPRPAQERAAVDEPASTFHDVLLMA